MDKTLSFADLALQSSLKHNRSLKNMEKLGQSIDWNRINTILLSHYTVGTASEGTDAYPSLLLYKCLLLQKWFHIDSDPELENAVQQASKTLGQPESVSKRLISWLKEASERELSKEDEASRLSDLYSVLVVDYAEDEG